MTEGEQVYWLCLKRLSRGGKKGRAAVKRIRRLGYGIVFNPRRGWILISIAKTQSRRAVERRAARW